MKPADEDCEICAGSGVITESFAAAISATANQGHFVAGGRCLCTVDWDEMREALPGVIDDILARSEAENGDVTCPP